MSGVIANYQPIAYGSVQKKNEEVAFKQQHSLRQQESENNDCFPSVSDKSISAVNERNKTDLSSISFSIYEIGRRRVNKNCMLAGPALLALAIIYFVLGAIFESEETVSFTTPSNTEVLGQAPSYLPNPDSDTVENASSSVSTSISDLRQMFEILSWEHVVDEQTGEEYFIGYLEFCSNGNDVFGYRTWDGASEVKDKYSVEKRSVCGANPSPMIRIVPGKLYKLIFLNNGHVETNLHTHGLHLSGVGDVDDVTRRLEPGKCLVYKIHILDDADVGTFFYHSHLHPLAFNQVQGGAYGFLIIDETEETVNNYYPSHLRRFFQNEVPLQLYSTRDKSTNPPTFTRKVNGRDTLDLNLVQNEYYYFRISSVIMTRPQSYIEFYPKEACETRVIAYDGVYRSKIPHEEIMSKHMLTSSSRLDLAVRCKKDATIFFYVKSRKEVGALRISLNTTTNIGAHTTANVSENFENDEQAIASPFWDPISESQWSPRRAYYLPNLRVDSADETFNLTSAEPLVYGETSFSINDEVWDTKRPLKRFELNTLVEMNLYGTKIHPLHFHINRMQIVEPGGCGYRYEEGEYYDTIAAHTQDALREKCTVRMQFFDYAGRIIAHCHRLNHEDQGMMFWFEVTDGPGYGVEGAPQVECSAA